MQAQMPHDPALAFVAGGFVGESQLINEDGLSGAETVTILTQYESALGQTCRTYAIARAGAPSQQLACETETGWRAIPPLLNPQHEVVLP